MKNWIVYFAIFLLSFHILPSQVVFSETFNEATGSTSGNDNTGGVSWSTSCSGCLTGDYFNVQGGSLQCDDTNGAGVWISNAINITACTGGITIALDISESNASNSFEECTTGCGCNCVDWISFEYNLNNSGYVPFTHAQGGTCNEGCSGGTYILLGEINPGSNFNFSQCLSPGTSLRLRLSVQTWAQGEIYNFDNITVSCSSCALPIELMYFEAMEKAGKVELNWKTSSERDNSYFIVERSTDALHFDGIEMVKGAGNSNHINSYAASDLHPPDAETVYYRLRQTDTDGGYTYSEMRAVHLNARYNTFKNEILPNPSVTGIFNLYGIGTDQRIEVLDPAGRKVAEMNSAGDITTIDLNQHDRGVYIVRLVSESEVKYYKIIYQ